MQSRGGVIGVCWSVVRVSCSPIFLWSLESVYVRLPLPILGRLVYDNDDPLPSSW